jgi:hypothetical protein
VIDGDGVISEVRTAGLEEDDRAYRRTRASEQRDGERVRKHDCRRTEEWRRVGNKRRELALGLQGWFI